jgi:hypothetical protein
MHKRKLQRIRSNIVLRYDLYRNSPEACASAIPKTFLPGNKVVVTGIRLQSQDDDQ